MSEISDMPFNIVYLAIGAVAWTAAFLKARAWLRDPSRGLLVVALTLASPAAAFVIGAPVVYRLIDRLTHRGNLATLLVYLGIMGFSAGAVTLARMWTLPKERAGSRALEAPATATWPELRWRLAVFAGAAVVMVGLFGIGGADHPETPLTFDTTFATIPHIAAFLGLYQALFGFALIDISQVCRGHAARLPPGWLRRGMSLISIGGLIACGYVLCKIIAIGAAFAGITGTEWLSTALGPAFAALGAVLITTGFAGPAAATWAGRRRDYQALRPLWDLAYRVDQRLVLEAPPSLWTEQLALRDLEWRTTRRGLEIRDGQLTLRPWIDPAVVTAAATIAERAGLPDEDREALIVAAALRRAVDALAAGTPPRPREDQTPLPGLDTEPADERAHLVRVAHYLHAPLTGAAIAVATTSG